jgi:predicted nucleic acid-binding protein
MNAVDTNVFVYAMHGEDQRKRERAVALLAGLRESNTVLLWQVACEVGAVFSRHIAQKALPASAYDSITAARERFPLALPSAEMLRTGLEIHRSHQVSYWDAMLIAACADAGVTRLYTEDDQSMPTIAGVEIINPFR